MFCREDGSPLRNTTKAQRMSNIGQPSPQQVPPKGLGSIITMAVVTFGLLLGSIFGHAPGWNRTIMSPSAGSLSRAEQEF